MTGLPITVVAWIFVTLLRPKSRFDFERLHQGVYLVIVGLGVVAFIGAIVGAVVIQIGWHPWVLLILVPLVIVVSLIDYSTTKARRRQRQG